MVDLWSDESRFALWLEIETVALEAMVVNGIAPKEALAAVKAKGGFDTARVHEIEAEVKHDVIAFLTSVAEHVGEEARWLHYGMTSSDLLDTCFALQLIKATDSILDSLSGLLEVVKKRAFEHKHTICIGRSHGIHAEPTTFGLKVATWYAALKRQETLIKNARDGVAIGSVSGPVGTYAHLGPEIEIFVCKKLGLKPANISTQVIPRDAHAALFSSYAQLATVIEQIAVEIRHLQRTEVREAEEFFSAGQKGSSAMPHKRNPVLTENLTGLARLIRSWAATSLENIVLWHERDISHSSVERVIAPDSTITLDFMLARITSVVSKLVVYPDNMQRNLDLTGGLYASGSLLVALAAKGIAREVAYKMVQEPALATWDAMNAGDTKAASFPERVQQDQEIKQYLSEDELNSCLSLQRHTAHVDHIFTQVFGESG
ncbi:UNVERIFIED_CONTAM: hypothetical protein GTU68_054011 [Idotea baltica]|nr:hypothetical protein [Idotea baltica]